MFTLSKFRKETTPTDEYRLLARELQTLLATNIHHEEECHVEFTRSESLLRQLAYALEY